VLTSLIVWLLIGSARAGGSAQRAIDEGSANLLVGAVALVWASLAMDRLGLPPSGRWVIPLTWALAAAIAWGIGWIDRRSETA
jgi:hypothetical protein